MFKRQVQIEFPPFLIPVQKTLLAWIVKTIRSLSKSP